MPRADLAPLRQCLHQAPVHYLQVRPRGFVLKPEHRPRPCLHARILGYGNARTRYHDRQPACRSLDGLRPTAEPQRRCAECPLRSRCTAQLRLDLIAKRQPWRLLLEHTNTQRFLLYHARLRQRAIAIEDIVHRLDVINRGSWGELCFHALPEPTNAPCTPPTSARSPPPAGDRT